MSTLSNTEVVVTDQIHLSAEALDNLAALVSDRIAALKALNKIAKSEKTPRVPKVPVEKKPKAILDPRVMAMIQKLHSLGNSDKVIASRLNAEGLTTVRGMDFGSTNVAQLRFNAGLKTNRANKVDAQHPSTVVVEEMKPFAMTNAAGA